MAVHEPVHACQFSASRVAISAATVTIIALVPFVAIFLSHEGARVLLELLANFGVTLQILLQGWVVFHELPVIDERGIFTELFRDLRMAVHEPVNTCQFSASRVAISTATIAVSVTIE